jgi:predicted metal-binding protein
MAAKTKIGIVICDRYRRCAGGKCLRAMRNKEGAFNRYTDTEIELVGFTTCDGCPGGNIEYAGEEMVKNGAEVIHLATGLVVGYPPCPHIDHFCEFIQKRYNLKVVIGTHPIPQKYFVVHQAMKTWSSPEWQERIKLVIENEAIRLAYD